MFRIAPVQPQDATGDVKVLAVSPQALRGYLGFSGALAAGLSRRPNGNSWRS
jgi:hypothetical protein